MGHREREERVSWLGCVLIACVCWVVCGSWMNQANMLETPYRFHRDYFGTLTIPKYMSAGKNPYVFITESFLSFYSLT